MTNWECLSPEIFNSDIPDDIRVIHNVHNEHNFYTNYMKS